MPGPHLLPQAVRLDSFRAGATDVRGIDLTTDLGAPFNDKVGQIDSVVVAGRDDGQALQSGDLTVMASPVAPYIDSTGMIVAWWQTCDPSLYSDGVTVDYHIIITVTTTSGRVLVVDAMQLVMPIRG